MDREPAVCAAYAPIFSPVATALIGFGVVAAVVMSVRWSTGNMRRRQIVQHIQQEPLAFLTPSMTSEAELRHTPQSMLPGVSLVMPVKMSSIKSASPKENWRSQINTLYAGFTEAIFVS